MHSFCESEGPSPGKFVFITFSENEYFVISIVISKFLGGGGFLLTFLCLSPRFSFLCLSPERRLKCLRLPCLRYAFKTKCSLKLALEYLSNVECSAMAADTGYRFCHLDVVARDIDAHSTVCVVAKL